MSNQIDRIFFIYRKLVNGLKVSTIELQQIINEEFGETSLRTIQRDMAALREIEPLIEQIRNGKEVSYKMNKEGIKQTKIEIFDNELLSLHILKSYLKAFKNTVIEDDTNNLISKLEDHVKGDVFDNTMIFWDKNPGYFDYTQFDPQIRQIIEAINYQKWVDVIYNNDIDKPKSIICLLRKLFTYSGAIYVVAYVPKHKSHIAIAIQNIESVLGIYRLPKEYRYHKLPPFSMEEFLTKRFGVFEGEIEEVELEIDKNLAHYFDHRNWHPSQKITKKSNGDLILTMNVPVTYELISWVMSWSDAITVKKPKKLIDKIIEQAEKINNKYKN